MGKIGDWWRTYTTNFNPKQDRSFREWLLRKQSIQLELQEQLWASNVLSTAKLEWGGIGQKPTRPEVTGVAVEHLIQARLLAKGLYVSQPTCDSGYDLIVDANDGVINRLQIRSTSCLQYANSGKSKYYRIKVGGIGNYSVLVAYLVPTDDLYFIPWDVVKDKHTLSFPAEKTTPYDGYKENYSILQTTH